MQTHCHRHLWSGHSTQYASRNIQLTATLHYQVLQEQENKAIHSKLRFLLLHHVIINTYALTFHINEELQQTYGRYGDNSKKLNTPTQVRAWALVSVRQCYYYWLGFSFNATKFHILFKKGRERERDRGGRERDSNEERKQSIQSWSFHPTPVSVTKHY